MFQSDIFSRSEQKMDMFRHYHKRMDLKASFAAITIHSLQEETNVILDNEESPSLPG